MKTSLFDFHLPESLIATRPAFPRDAARMLAVSEDGFHDRLIGDVIRFLRPGDVMVFNDSKVIPARLWGKRGEAKVEVLLHKPIALPGLWRCFAKPAKKLTSGDLIAFSPSFHALVLDKQPSGEVVLQFEDDHESFWEKLETYGAMPLPPYIERRRAADSGDCESYQTVYARHAGSVAAPTAGLHFTQALLEAIDAIGVTRAHVTLHVGGGTFLPVKADDTAGHVMHGEYAAVPGETAEAVNQAKSREGRVIAVGTTSLRVLESYTDATGKLQALQGETDIFITPGYRFRLVDALLTNFHLPRSTLFMLVSAFAGLERMKSAYNHAITNNYRFYSYGDACLLSRTGEPYTHSLSNDDVALATRRGNAALGSASDTDSKANRY